MGTVLLRVALLALGMGLVEIGLTAALGQNPLAGWALVLLGGAPLVLLGTAGFVGPLVGTGRSRGDRGND